MGREIDGEKAKLLGKTDQGFFSTVVCDVTHVSARYN